MCLINVELSPNLLSQYTHSSGLSWRCHSKSHFNSISDCQVVPQIGHFNLARDEYVGSEGPLLVEATDCVSSGQVKYLSPEETSPLLAAFSNGNPIHLYSFLGDDAEFMSSGQFRCSSFVLSVSHVIRGEKFGTFAG